MKKTIAIVLLSLGLLGSLGFIGYQYVRFWLVNYTTTVQQQDLKDFNQLIYKSLEKDGYLPYTFTNTDGKLQTIILAPYVNSTSTK